VTASKLPDLDRTLRVESFSQLGIIIESFTNNRLNFFSIRYRSRIKKDSTSRNTRANSLVHTVIGNSRRQFILLLVGQGRRMRFGLEKGHNSRKGRDELGIFFATHCANNEFG
jgi:hypothetical protein